MREQMPVPTEASLARNVESLLSTTASLRFDDAATRRVFKCWADLHRSGVPQRRGFASALHFVARAEAAQVNAVAAAAAAPGLRHCALASCNAREAHPDHFKSCAACRKVEYCCKEHQAEDWPAHKAACKATRNKKAAAAADSAGTQSG